jgi:HAD superfamily hydrolase (TIGR01484 family)
MSLIPASRITEETFKDIQIVATDMDGTLTCSGKFTPNLLQALAALQEAKILVIIVTGRSAGWVQGVKNYLPIGGAIAENGGVFFSDYIEQPDFLISLKNLTAHRQILAQIFQQLKRQFPQIIASADNDFRLTDWTFNIQGLTTTDLQQIEEFCLRSGWGFTYSTVQCHIKPLAQNKASGLLEVILNYFPGISPEQVLTVGDSPNDESLFDRSKFPISVGVANIIHYGSQLNHLPLYVTAEAEGAGFCELAQLLLKYRSNAR